MNKSYITLFQYSIEPKYISFFYNQKIISSFVPFTYETEIIFEKKMVDKIIRKIIVYKENEHIFLDCCKNTKNKFWTCYDLYFNNKIYG